MCFFYPPPAWVVKNSPLGCPVVTLYAPPLLGSPCVFCLNPFCGARPPTNFVKRGNFSPKAFSKRRLGGFFPLRAFCFLCFVGNLRRFLENLLLDPVGLNLGPKWFKTLVCLNPLPNLGRKRDPFLCPPLCPREFFFGWGFPGRGTNS